MHGKMWMPSENGNGSQGPDGVGGALAYMARIKVLVIPMTAMDKSVFRRYYDIVKKGHETMPLGSLSPENLTANTASCPCTYGMKSYIGSIDHDRSTRVICDGGTMMD